MGGALRRRFQAMGIYPVEPLLLTLELRERCENLGAMMSWINTRPNLGDVSVGTHQKRVACRDSEDDQIS
jgi:hypothetical protein